MIKKLIFTAFFSLFVYMELSGQPDVWEGFVKDSVLSPLDGYINRFYYCCSTTHAKQPLVVSIHQWSAGYDHFTNSLASETRAKNWNYIHPDVRGANNHPKACGSDYLVADIDQAIDWAIKNLPVDTSRIYIIGASGGGYNALCHLMKSKRQVREYSVWVPITDLNRWYEESKSRKSRYAEDITQCICKDCPSYDSGEARNRSPLHQPTPIRKIKNTHINIYAGVHDGYTGAVPIYHSIAFYNKIVKDTGGNEDHVVSDEEIIWMLTTRTSFSGIKGQIGNRKMHCYKSYKNISLTIFEGGHEILTDIVLDFVK